MIATHSSLYLGAFVVVTGVAVGLAVLVGDRDLAFAAAILGLYVLHMVSVRTLIEGQREQSEAVRELEDLVGELGRAERAGLETLPPGETRDEPVSRHFALGTVAIIRGALTAEEVSRILVEQRDHPDRRFGELALEMELLEEDQLEVLLRDQQDGEFSRREIRSARKRLETYHRRKRDEIEQGSGPFG